MWYVFMEAFNEAGERHKPRQCMAKSVLYSAIKGEAKELIAPHMNPALAKYRQMNIKQYAREVQSVFEPVSDAPRMRMMFVLRKQNRLEHALKYAQHKLHLFLVAYPQEYPPWSVYYEETLNGLINSTVANEMRRYTPTPINNVPGFRTQIERIMQAMQGSVLAGQMKDTELVGIEMDVVINPVSYRNTETTAVLDRAESIGEEINAMRNNNCFHCNEPGHLIRDCPGKRAGTKPAQGINALQQGTNTTTDGETVETVGKRPYIPYKIIRKPPTHPIPVRRRKHVAVLETDDGKMYEDPFQETEEAGSGTRAQKMEPQVNTVNTEVKESDEESDYGNGFQDVPYCAETFLGD